MDRVQAMAETTAIACGICSDKPYDDEKVTHDKNKVVNINEHHGVVLACKTPSIIYYPPIGVSIYQWTHKVERTIIYFIRQRRSSA